MSTEATMQAPTIPPRPSRSTDKDAASASSLPAVPPRPASKRIERSVSPNPDRFAPSPLNAGIPPKGSQRSLRPSSFHEHQDDPIERTGSVPMPSVGEEGMEYGYGAVADGYEQPTLPSKRHSASPEQTRLVAEDLKLHAPKPSLPAQSAKQRVSAVTRTDSDKAASFGIGRPAHYEERSGSRTSMKKRPSSSFSTHSQPETDDDHGIPEIGQRVPMNPHLGDVQAPSPAPGHQEGSKKHHSRRHSARSVPPGSYGLHGHGVAPHDKLEKAYYQKHPDLLEKEQHPNVHDRQNDFAMSRAELNKLVRDTPSRRSAMGSSSSVRGGPTDEVAFQASEEYASRMSTPRPASTQPKTDVHGMSPLKQFKSADQAGETIHVDDPKHPQYRSYGDGDNFEAEEDHAPILAADEIRHEGYYQQPAVHPPPERRGSAFEMEEPSSRPSSRPTSLYNNHSQVELTHTPLEDVEEYEPLFPEDSEKAQQKQKQKQKNDLDADENRHRHHFPSKDIWEDAPNSVHFTAEVSTPEQPATEHKRKSSSHNDEHNLGPAHLFAQQQEQLAKKEAGLRSASHSSLLEEKPVWTNRQDYVKADRSGSGHRFPSRDVWEETPESLLQETELSGSPSESRKPEIPARPSKTSDLASKPSIPERPKPRQDSGDDSSKSKPPVSDKPKPQIPARPAKSGSGDAESPKEKPPVPSRVGGKIAALQAGFMNDLNNRLRIGPQIQKKEEVPEEPQEEKEKAPLSDARKGRARGPQRRAPAKSPAPTSETAKQTIPTFTFTAPLTSWSIDPDAGTVSVDEKRDEELETEETEPRTDTVPDAGAITDSTPATLEAPAPAPAIPSLNQEDHKANKVEGNPDVAVATETEAKPYKEDEHLPSSRVTESPALVDKDPEEHVTEQKTLVSNMAGESILQTSVDKSQHGNEIEPKSVEEEVQS